VYDLDGFDRTVGLIAFIEFPKTLRADPLLGLVLKGAYPGVDTPLTPDEPDVLDGGEVVGGLGDEFLS
jgi:hypothetical protein